MTDFWDWLQVGLDKGWVSEPFCNTHDGDPNPTDEELEAWEAGEDPCLPVLKILEPARASE